MVDQTAAVKRRRVDHAEKWKKPGDWWPSSSGKYEMTKCTGCSIGVTVEVGTCRDCRDKLTTVNAAADILERRALAELDRRRDEGTA